MKKLIIPLLLVSAVLMAACAAPAVTAPSMVAPAEINARLADAGTEYILLDVRTQAEWENDGHIEGATLIPVEELSGRLNELPDQDAEIVVYCRSGNRSNEAANILAGAGYVNVSDMGGINNWISAGYPVIYGP